jgi:hypothetical protein
MNELQRREQAPRVSGLDRERPMYRVRPDRFPCGPAAARYVVRDKTQSFSIRLIESMPCLNGSFSGAGMCPSGVA